MQQAQRSLLFAVQRAVASAWSRSWPSRSLAATGVLQEGGVLPPGAVFSMASLQPSRRTYTDGFGEATAGSSGQEAGGLSRHNQGAQQNSSTPVAGAVEPVIDADTPPLSLDSPSTALDAPHIGNFYPFKSQLVPEAFQQFHQAFYAPRPSHLQRKGGCRSLQAEFKTSGSTHLMYRRCTHELRQAVSSGAATRILLNGPPGAGKSIALVQLVEWARASGWLAVYVPSASALTGGGYFYQRQDGSGLYDTIISAQHILKSVTDAHRDQLAALSADAGRAATTSTHLPAAGADGGVGGSSVLDVAMAGLRTDNDGQLAVESVLRLLRELAVAAANGARVLIAVDDYNALHWRTRYGATTYVGGFSARNVSKRQYMHRRELHVEELALACALRVLAPAEQRDPAGGGLGNLGPMCVVGAVTAGGGVSPRAPIALVDDVQEFHVPRYSFVEAAHALCFYHERGLLGDVPSEQQVTSLRSITNGHAGELRRLALQASTVDLQAYA